MFSTFCAGAAAAPEVILRVQAPIPDHAIGRVVLAPELGPAWSRMTGACAIKAAKLAGGRSVAVLVADPDDALSGPARGATVYVTTGAVPAGDYLVQAAASSGATASGPRKLAAPHEVRGQLASVTFDPSRNGGFPTTIRFMQDAGHEDGAPLESFVWNDRVYEAGRGGWLLRNDRSPTVEVLHETDELTIIRVRARYCNEDGRPAPGGARATYDWYVARNRPEVFVQAFVAQDEPLSWPELHHIEFNLSDARFTQWAGGSPFQTGALSGSRKTIVTPEWACLVAGRLAIGLVGGQARIYDGRGEYGTYVHGAWQQWGSQASDEHSARRRRMSAWMWIGSADDPAREIERRSGPIRIAQTSLTTKALRTRIAALQARGAIARARRLAAPAKRLEESGDLSAASALAEAATAKAPTMPKGWLILQAGALSMAVQRTDSGIVVRSLQDSQRDVEIASAAQPPLFRLSLSRRGSDPFDVTASHGWKRTSMATVRGSLVLRWLDHSDPRAAGVAVTATARPDGAASALYWDLRVETTGSPCGVRSAAFPQVSVEPPAPDARSLYPTGPGAEQRLASVGAIERNSLYPNGWCSMQFMAVYSPSRRAGLYYACHDPNASAKHIIQRRADGDRAVLLAFDVPAPHMGEPGATFEWPGTAVWQALHGDWYDAASIYGAWVRAHADWWPKLTKDGRADTPRWMRDLCAWAQTGGAPGECAEQLKRMQRTLGVPIGFHWYNWHQIPFDNDYPHYFPTKPGVADAVADLQANNVFVMPYINGRLWDTRDRGSEDYQFTSVALPASTKGADGKPYTETYGSKEADGSPVHLAVMCPTTPLWRSKVHDTVLRIMNEVGAKGVYIDQIAAAAPALCMDASHGHPLGGGCWWTRDGYWPLLAAIRRDMGSDRMITTECAAEPYAHRVDGFLTWDWQGDQMVPALPAIYGGAVQYFGRNYAAGATTRDDALCMKMGQQLVFGEQIGWLSPSVADEPVAGAFLKQVVGARSRFVRFFNAGRMARPPRLVGEIPDVRADWAWYGETWVTTPAILTGAWVRPREILLLFVNVSDKPVSATYRWDASAFGIAAGDITCAVARGAGAPSGEPARMPRRTTRKLEIPGRAVEAWLIRW